MVYRRQATLPLDLKIPHEIEKEGENPMMDRLYQLITDLEDDHIEVQQRIEQQQQKQKQSYDKQGISQKLKIGDQVLVEWTWLKNNFLAKLENK